MRVPSTRMSQRLIAGLSLAVIALALPGCTRIRTHQGYLVDNLLVDSIQPGIDNRESVEGTLGRPTFTSQFGGGDYYYVGRDMRQLAFSNPKPKEATVLRVRFDQAGNVVGVDRAGIDKIVDVSPKDGKTPTLGRHRTLFQEVFGNIGAVGAGGMGSSGGSSNTGGPNGS